MSRKFKWDAWNFDCDGEAYVIAQDECPNREDVPEWIVKQDNLSLDVLDWNQAPCLSIDDINDGWCKHQVRSDWDDNGCSATGAGYYVQKGTVRPGKQGWFPVWIVRKGEWY